MVEAANPYKLHPTTSIVLCVLSYTVIVHLHMLLIGIRAHPNTEIYLSQG